jgi:hypothetical protein
MRQHLRIFGIASLLLLVSLLAHPARSQTPSPTSRDWVAESAHIDRLLFEVAQYHGLQAAPQCSDELFLRRATLDLLGRIPTPTEHAEFIAAPDRPALIQRLLQDESFPKVWADLWTTQLVGYVDANESERDSLAHWLEEQVRDGRPADRIAYDLIAATGQSAFDGHVNFLLRFDNDPIVKVSRAFLGVRLDCARCHDHPFDRWTEEDFAKMNRFFEPLRREEISRGNIRLSDVIVESDPDSLPRFLTGARPRTTQWRQEFALFVTKSRPFARNYVNRLWYHFMGRGIVHPVDDVNRDNPAAVPELLEWLTDEAIRSGFDTRSMIQLICNSQAYQRDSAFGGEDELRRKLFLVRSIKPLPAEHWYASMCVALDRAPRANERQDFILNFHGDIAETDFSASWEYRETMQGLMSRLVGTVEPPGGNLEEQFVRFLGRLPSDEERRFFENSRSQEVAYVLLHSSEFAFNH